jgi:hypothetical protein
MIRFEPPLRSSQSPVPAVALFFQIRSTTGRRLRTTTVSLCFFGPGRLGENSPLFSGNIHSGSFWFHLPPFRGTGSPDARFANASIRPAKICPSFYSPPHRPRHWYPAYSHHAKPSHAFSISSALRRRGLSRNMPHYGQAGKRRGDLLTGDRGHHPEILGYCWMTVCRSGRHGRYRQRSALIPGVEGNYEPGPWAGQQSKKELLRTIKVGRDERWWQRLQAKN